MEVQMREGRIYMTFLCVTEEISTEFFARSRRNVEFQPISHKKNYSGRNLYWDLVVEARFDGGLVHVERLPIQASIRSDSFPLGRRFFIS